MTALLASDAVVHTQTVSPCARIEMRAIFLGCRAAATR